jgi:hypothetical protein
MLFLPSECLTVANQDPNPRQAKATPEKRSSTWADRAVLHQ